MSQTDNAHDVGDAAGNTEPSKPDKPNPPTIEQQREEPTSNNVEGSEQANDGVAEGKERPSNPFAEASNDAFSSHRVYLRGRRSFAHGSAAFIDRSQLGDVYIGDRVVQNFHAAHHGRLAHGPVRSEVLELIRACYVQVDGYQRLLEALNSRHIIVLRGQPGTGRATTGIHLLDRLSGGKVARLDPGKALTIDEFDLEDGLGYLVNEPTSDASDVLQETYLDRVSARLQDRGCYCVMIVDQDPLLPGTLGGYIEECTSPDVWDVVMSHVRWAVRDVPDDGLYERLREVASRPQTRQALGPAPRMTEVIKFADLLVRHGKEDLPYDRVLSQCHEFLLQQVLEWFSDLRRASRGFELDREVRLASFRVALAVFDGMPYHDVAETADELAEKVISAVTTRRYRPVVGGDWRRNLPALRAELYDDAFDEIHDVPLPVRAVRFQDQRFQEMIIAYLWRWHDTLRAPFIDWLTGLNTRRRQLWTRAAQALGVVCSLDFPSVYETRVRLWANSDDARQRMAAALALDQAARDQRVQPAVEAILRAWVRSGTDAERWTAAAALGHDIGLDDADRSLDELRIVGTSETSPFAPKPSLVSVASWSASALLSAGKVEPVLRNLRSWIRDRRCRHMALMTILRIMSARVSDADAEVHGIEPGKERWPLILALNTKDHVLGSELADMVWHALRLPPAQEVAVEALARWIRRGEGAGYLEELADFLPLLIDDEADEQRLMHLLVTMRRAWIDPLRGDVADLIEKAIHPAHQGTVRTCQTLHPHLGRSTTL
ncbi:MAG TPA: hypothetical protein VFZ32_03835 [Micromonosporaceae bacterium]